LLEGRAIYRELRPREGISRTPGWITHAVLTWRHSEVGHWHPAIWRERRWEHALVWLAVWLREHRHNLNGIVAESLMCQSHCWYCLALDVRESYGRHKHAMPSRKLWWRSREEQGMRLWAYEVVGRHLIPVGCLAVGMHGRTRIVMSVPASRGGSWDMFRS
jgi:hypothetical protein